MITIASQECIGNSDPGSLLVILKIRRWVYVGEDSTFRINLETRIGDRIPRIPIGRFLEESSHTLRQPFIDWIGELSALNDSDEWWSSEIAAKNPFYLLFVRICLLNVAQKLIGAAKTENILVVCSTDGMVREVARLCENTRTEYRILPQKKLRGALGHAAARARLAMYFTGLRLPPLPFLDQWSRSYASLLEKHPGYRRDVLDRYCIHNEPFAGPDSVLFVTWVDARNVTRDFRYSDPNFGILPEKLRRRGYRVAFLARVLPTVPFEPMVKSLAATSEHLLYPEKFVSVDDWIDCRNRAFSFSPEIPETDRFGNFSASSIARENTDETRLRHIDSLMVGKIVAGMARDGIRPGQIIYTCEGHSWEHALNRAVRRHLPGTATVGYDNLTFSTMVVSMFPARNELAIRPAPDRIVTNGELYRRILIGAGIPAERVVRGCALRNQYLFEPDGMLKETVREKPQGPERVLVATTLNTGESVDLIEKAIRALGGNRNFEISIKCHPLSDRVTIRSSIGELSSCGNVRWEDSPVTDLLGRSGYIIYSYTTVCFDALLYNVIPIWVNAENFINLDKLDSVPDARYVVSTPEELRNLVIRLESMGPAGRESFRARAKAVLLDAFSPVDDESIGSFVVSKFFSPDSNNVKYLTGD